MGAVHGVADIAGWELGRHLLLRGNRDGLVLLGKEKADFDTVVPRRVLVVVREDTCRLRLESRNGLLDKCLVGNIGVEDLSGVGNTDEIALEEMLLLVHYRPKL